MLEGGEHFNDARRRQRLVQVSNACATKVARPLFVATASANTASVRSRLAAAALIPQARAPRLAEKAMICAIIDMAFAFRKRRTSAGSLTLRKTPLAYVTVAASLRLRRPARLAINFFKVRRIAIIL